MKKLLNTLYITTPNAYLSKEGENVVINIDNKKVKQYPIHTLEGIACFGYQGASPALMHLCTERGVGLSFHNEYGKFLARVEGTVKGNVLLRKQQYKFHENEEQCLSISKLIITAKIVNTKSVLARALRDHEDKVNAEKITQVVYKLENAIKNINTIEDIDSLRGLEGICAKDYFSVFNELILQQKEDFLFESRIKRPPTDNINALLSFIYTMLSFDVRSALEMVGLDPFMGFMHQLRPGRPSLALDLMEEFRPMMADRIVLSLINKKQITKKDFVKKENSTVILETEARKKVLEAIYNRKKEEIIHPFLQEKIPIGLIPYSQAMLLARFLRGDINNYPPFVWK